MKIRAVKFIVSAYGSPVTTTPYRAGDTMEFYDLDHDVLGHIEVVSILQTSVVIKLRRKDVTLPMVLSMPDYLTLNDIHGREALRVQIDSIGNIFDTNDPVIDTDNPSLN